MLKGLPPLAPLVTFVVAAETRSFARAAEKLLVTQAAVSKAVKSLEGYLGTTLFVRGPRSVTLTDAGVRYYEAVRDALRTVERATIRECEGRSRPALTVVAYPSFVLRWLVPRMRSFRSTHPEIDIRFATTLGELELQGEDMKAAILTEERDFRGCDSEYLFTFELFPVCSPRLRDGPRPLRYPEDLRDHTLLHVQTRADDWSRWLRVAAINGVDATSGLMLESSSMAYQAAIDELGVAMALGDLVMDDLRHGRLCAPFGRSVHVPVRLYLVYPPEFRGTSVLSSFGDWMRAAR